MFIGVLTDFFVKHYVFRWRSAMNEFYTAHWPTVRGIEGASQRVQEDTNRFARIMEDLGISFVRSVLTLIAFLPILWTFSGQVKELPWIGPVNQALVWVAIAFALSGTVALGLIGFKLPGLEFENQRVEAAYRKELSAYGEDDHESGPTDRCWCDCSATFGATISGCFSTTCISTSRDGRTCRLASSSPTSPSVLPLLPAASRWA